MSELVRELLPGVYRVATDYPQVADVAEWLYVVRGEQSLMCDAACATTWDAVLHRAFDEIAMTAADLDWALLTHGHPDHTGAVKSLRSAGSSVRVAAPLGDVQWIEEFDLQWRQFWSGHPAVVDVAPAYDEQRAMSGGDLTVDRILRDGERLELGDRAFEVHVTRGHTPGHAAYFDRDSGVMLTGDLGLGRLIPNLSKTSNFGPLYMDVDEHLDGLRRLRELPFSWVCPAHLDPVQREEGLKLFDDAIAMVDETDAVVMSVIASGDPVPMREIAQALGDHWGMTPAIWVHSAYVAQAHLRRAARRGLVEPSWALAARH
jgi:glyoxylase-like metal-dependent hydrolase (beta-lactamase superfamily II)